MQSCLSKQPFGCIPHGSITGFELEFSNPVIHSISINVAPASVIKGVCQIAGQMAR
jgi:hypothetical protein